jgi:hypothetical protein
MPRYHSGGFIDSQFYFNIGAEAARGRDGDTARDAAKKYNDHRHSAYVAVSTNALRNWKNETQTASTDPASGNLGGLLQDANEFLRLPGDLAELNAVLYAATSGSVKSISSGFGVHIDMTPAIPEIVEDFVSTNYTMMRRPTPPEGIACLFAADAGNLQVPFNTTIADCVLYPSIQAGSGDLVTQVIVTAGVKVASAPSVDLNDGLGAQALGEPNSVLPRIAVYLTPKYSPYNEATQRIVSANVTEGPKTLITSMTGNPFNTISNSDDLGYTVVGALSLPGNFAGRIELEMAFDTEGCYTADDYASVAAAFQTSVPELQSAISTWASDNVRLDLLDASARVLCTFRGQ